MIETIVRRMRNIATQLKETILKDIEDVKNANHEALLSRNDEKLEKMQTLVSLKKELNDEIVKLMQSGNDVNVYRQMVDDLEVELKELFELNRKLGAIILPIKQMYKEIVEDISKNNGGNIFEVKA